MNRCILIALCALLAACADTKPATIVAVPVARPSAPPVAPTPASSLGDGIALYEKGDYNRAVKQLALASVPTAPKTTQLRALKFTAFSYCLMARQLPCRQAFEKALKLDPAFDLEPGEKGHPLWGPAWLKAKKGKV